MSPRTIRAAQNGMTHMPRTDLIHEAEEAPDAARAMALYRQAIDQTGIISEAVRRQLIAMIGDSLPAPHRPRERPGRDAGADGGEFPSRGDGQKCSGDC